MGNLVSCSSFNQFGWIPMGDKRWNAEHFQSFWKQFQMILQLLSMEQPKWSHFYLTTRIRKKNHHHLLLIALLFLFKVACWLFGLGTKTTWGTSLKIRKRYYVLWIVILMIYNFTFSHIHFGEKKLQNVVL